MGSARETEMCVEAIDARELNGNRVCLDKDTLTEAGRVFTCTHIYKTLAPCGNLLRTYSARTRVYVSLGVSHTCVLGG